MINARLMYLRPGNLFKDFTVESNTQKVTSTGRVATTHMGDGSVTLRGCLADSTDDEKKSHSTQEHTVTHTIVQQGPPKRTDKLILGERVFYIVDIDNTGSLGVATLYYAEERRDVK